MSQQAGPAPQPSGATSTNDGQTAGTGPTPGGPGPSTDQAKQQLLLAQLQHAQAQALRNNNNNNAGGGGSGGAQGSPAGQAPQAIGAFDPQIQQQLLAQFAARLPGNNNNNNQNATGNNPNSNNPIFPNLAQLNLPPGRKLSGASASNGTAGSPAASSPSAPTAGNANLAELHAQLQSRMLQAQQAVNQAARQRAASGSGPQQQQQQQQQQQPGQQQPGNSNLGKLPNGLPDWTAAAAASGMLSNIASGAATDRDALMKQLQMLQAARTAKQQQGGPGTPASGAPTAPSPASVTAPSPAFTAPSPAQNAAQTPVTAQMQLPATAPSPAAAASPATSLPGGVRPPGTPQSATGMSLASGIAQAQSGTPGGAPPRPPPGRAPAQLQKQHLLNSMVNFFKSTNQPLPPEVFANGEREGAFKLGDAWIELAEMFFAVFRLGGLMKLMQGGQSPTEHPVWQALLTSKNIAPTLPAPLALPRPPGMDPSQPSQPTTSAVQYLVAAYRAWVFGFEQAMARQKMAHLQKQAQQASAGGAPSPITAASPVVQTPQTAGPGSIAAASPATATAPSPAFAAMSPAVTAAAGSPAVAAAPSPAVAAPSPAPTQTAPPQSAATAPSPAQQPAPTSGPDAVPTPTASTQTPAPQTSAQGSTPAPPPQAQTPAPSTPATAVPPTDPTRPRIDIPSAPSPAASAAATPASAATPVLNGVARKRKRDLDSKPSTPLSAAHANASPVPPSPARSQGPKRPRYKVEYRPLHFPRPTLCGWDERVISTSFPKNNLGRPTHSAVELGPIDMEAILMGLRSRMPRELSYALTVLSMLSMPMNDDRVSALPILPMIDVYLEVIDLIADSALGDDGLEGWLKAREKPEVPEGTSRRPTPSQDEPSRMTYAELECLGHDFDYSVPDSDEATGGGETTGGATDNILAGLNIIRNFSLTAENQAVMARPELFNLIAAITDASLTRMSGQEQDGRKPYSVLELARVRRECVAILTNLGNHFDLRQLEQNSILSVFRLVSSFLVSGWETLRVREPGFGPAPSIREMPPSAVLSIDRALEAFSRLALADHNREVIAACVPTDELVELFGALVKLLPISRRDTEAMLSIEDYLGHVELVALSVYSLAFLSPTLARAGMRATPGATAILTRLVCELTPRTTDLEQSPFGILARRLAETLGVLNGTLTPGGNAEGMSFAAGGVDGKGWKFANDIVEPGWLAPDADRVFEAMGWGRGDGRVWRLDQRTFSELDGLWSG